MSDVIRPAVHKDVPELGRLGALLVSLHHDFDPDRFIGGTPNAELAYASFLDSQLKRPEIVVLVAEEAGKVVGYVYAGIEGNDYMALRGPAGVLYDLVVEPARRREGFGRLLLMRFSRLPLVGFGIGHVKSVNGSWAWPPSPKHPGLLRSANSPTSPLEGLSQTVARLMSGRPRGRRLVVEFRNATVGLGDDVARERAEMEIKRHLHDDIAQGRWIALGAAHQCLPEHIPRSRDGIDDPMDGVDRVIPASGVPFVKFAVAVRAREYQG